MAPTMPIANTFDVTPALGSRGTNRKAQLEEDFKRSNAWMTPILAICMFWAIYCMLYYLQFIGYIDDTDFLFFDAFLYYFSLFITCLRGISAISKISTRNAIAFKNSLVLALIFAIFTSSYNTYWYWSYGVQDVPNILRYAFVYEGFLLFAIFFGKSVKMVEAASEIEKA